MHRIFIALAALATAEIFGLSLISLISWLHTLGGDLVKQAFS